MVLGRACGSVWVASTCSTSDVPMPNAIEPNAPWVEVCESPQTVEGLWAGHLVHQVEIDVEEVGFPGGRVHDMRVPDLLAQRLRHGAVISSVVRRGWARIVSWTSSLGVVAMVRRVTGV
jgi:hypothetical protein